jgi:hypothetical protein
MNAVYGLGILLFPSTSYLLIVAALLGLCSSPTPIWLGRCILVLSIGLLAASTILVYAYGMELFIAHYSGDMSERADAVGRVTGLYAAAYWLFVGSAFVPQLFWFRRFRSRALPALLIALAATIPSAIWAIIGSPIP